MKLVLASDEKTPLTDSVAKYLQDKRHHLVLIGHLSDETKKWKWADIGKEAGQKVANQEVDQAVLFCWSGTGICIAANKVKGVRAALCWDSETAKLARKWDDANVLCMSLRYASETVAQEILEAWFSTDFDEEGLAQAHTVDN